MASESKDTPVLVGGGVGAAGAAFDMSADHPMWPTLEADAAALIVAHGSPSAFAAVPGASGASESKGGAAGAGAADDSGEDDAMDGGGATAAGSASAGGAAHMGKGEPSGAWLFKLTPLTKAFSDGTPRGRGWEWIARVRGPTGTSYAKGTHDLLVRFPPEYPDKPPFVRWATGVYHTQVDEHDGSLPPAFYTALDWSAHVAAAGREAWYSTLGNAATVATSGSGDDGDGAGGAEAATAVADAKVAGKDTHVRGLSRAVVAAVEMLERYLPEEEITDEQIIGMWRSHDPHCKCEMVPIPFHELAKLDDAIIEDMVDQFRERYKRLVVPQQRGQKEQLMDIQLFCRAKYKRRTPALFDDDAGWQESWFAPSFVSAIKDGSPEALRSILSEVAPGVYAFDLFTDEFCDTLLAEFKAYEKSDMPKMRPNSMNNYGLIANQIGMERMMTQLMQSYVRPIACLLFPEDGGATLDYQHTFMVQYMEGEDVSLDMHVDDSDVTLNVNLFDGFEGAGLTFCGRFHKADHRKKLFTYDHVKGRAVIHPGKHRHGADDITSGARYNLILWARSCTFRHTHAYHESMTPAKEAVDPDVVCLSRTHDMDYHKWVAAAKDSAS